MFFLWFGHVTDLRFYCGLDRRFLCLRFSSDFLMLPYVFLLTFLRNSWIISAISMISYVFFVSSHILQHVLHFWQEFAFFWFQVCIGPIMFNHFRGGWQNELKPGKLWEITRKRQERTRTYNMFCNFQDFLMNFVWFSYEFLIIFVKLCARGESPGKPWRNRKQIIGKLSVRTWRKHIANH